MSDKVANKEECKHEWSNNTGPTYCIKCNKPLVDLNDHRVSRTSPSDKTWEELAAEVAIKTWKGRKKDGYARHSQDIYEAMASATIKAKEVVLKECFGLVRNYDKGWIEGVARNHGINLEEPKS